MLVRVSFCGHNQTLLQGQRQIAPFAELHSIAASRTHQTNATTCVKDEV